MQSDEFLASLGKRIKKIRVKKKINQQTLAALCNFEKSNMSRLEKGNTNPTILTLLKISKALGVSVSNLFDFDEYSERDTMGKIFSSENLGHKVKAFRQLKALTQNQLASLLDCELSEIRALEDGHYDLAIATLRKIGPFLSSIDPD